MDFGLTDDKGSACRSPKSCVAFSFQRIGFEGRLTELAQELVDQRLTPWAPSMGPYA